MNESIVTYLQALDGKFHVMHFIFLKNQTSDVQKSEKVCINLNEIGNKQLIR